MAEMTAEEIAKLRKLAESAIVDGGNPWNDRRILDVGRGLLSALDALEADDFSGRYGALLPRLRAAEDALEAMESERDHYRTAHRSADIRAEAAEVSRDQAIKERDRWKQEAREWADACLENRAEADRLAEAIREYLSHPDRVYHGSDGIRAALAGVPGGSPEEHNPGGTAVAVPGSETAKARGEGLRGGSGASNVGRDPAAPLHTARDGKTGGAGR